MYTCGGKKSGITVLNICYVEAMQLHFPADFPSNLDKRTQIVILRLLVLATTFENSMGVSSESHRINKFVCD